MIVLDGKKLATKIEDKLKIEVEDLAKSSITPGLAVILVGEDAASATYVNMKARACKRVGIYSIVHEMPNTITTDNLLSTINLMNQNPNIHGILVQLPLPKHIDTNAVLEAISPHKDVDGFHPYNTGLLNSALIDENRGFAPATPLGVMELLKEYDIDIKGKNVTIVGASNIVGKPLAALMLNAGATISLCHIFTQDVGFYTRNADILCVGVGKVNLITKDMVKDGAIVIDIGINRLDSGALIGDVEYDGVSAKSSYITPVPGGVGPMTIASLLLNTIKATKIQSKIQSRNTNE